jgi:DNA-binding MarR family transcriptional regulator
MVAAGYVQRGVDAQDGRQRPVRLTSRGRELLGSVEQIYTELEREWATVIGAAQVQRMRRDLVRVLSDARSGELPPVRPIW